MDIDFYRDKMVLADHLHTNTYKTVPNNADNEVAKKLDVLITKHKKCLYPKEIEYICNK